MALGFIYDGSNAITEVNDNADGLEFATRTNSLVFHEGNTDPVTLASLYNLARTVPIRYLKKVGSLVQEMTQPEKDAVDAAIAPALLAAQRAAAESTFDSHESPGKILKAIVLLLIDELNILRGRDRDRSSDVAAATNLADLKTRWAARSSLDDRTAAQARAAIRGKIDDGSAD